MVSRVIFFGTVLLVACLLYPNTAQAAKIVIQAPKDLAEDVKNASLVVSTNESKDITAQDLISGARADYGRITGVLYEAGYYAPVINIYVDGREAADIPLLEDPKPVSKIVIRVQSGQRFRFSRAVVNPITSDTELPERFAAGKPARSDEIGKATDIAVEAWRNAGHAKVGIADQRYTANHLTHELSAEVFLDPGPRLRFGDLVVTSESKVRADRIREIAGLPTGDVYSPEELDLALTRLRDAGTFRSIALRDAENASPDGTLDIEVHVVDQKPRRFGAGVEFYSEDGLTLSGFWLHRNLFGGAERLRIEGMVGGIGGDSGVIDGDIGGLDYRGSIRLDRPATFDPDTDMYLELLYEKLNEPNFDQESFSLGGGVTHRFSNELTGELGVAYRYAKVDDPLGNRTLQHLLLPARLTWNTRDDNLDPSQGHYIDSTAIPFIGLNNNALGTRLYVDARKYHQFASSERLIVAGRVQAGTIIGADIEDIPPDMLFFSGGVGTVRGQKFQSLGIDVPNDDDDIGGRTFLGLSGEARYKIKRSIGAVAFADAGYIAKNSFGSGESDWQGGAGLGFRYYTGFGPIRVDVGTPLDSDAGKKYKLYIGIGQAF